MTIRKNADYGEPVERPLRLDVLHDDREIVDRYGTTSQLNQGAENNIACTVLRGSIAQALGISGLGRDTKHMTKVLIDLIHIEYRTTISSSQIHEIVVAGSITLHRRSRLDTFLVISNSGIVKGRDVLPRAHPNDGFMDVLTIDETTTIRQRYGIWKRAKNGSHLPHPHLHSGRHTHFVWTGLPCRMVADGVTYRGVEWMRCVVLGDAFSLIF